MKSVLFYCLVLFMMIANAFNLKAYDVILEEDEELLVGDVSGAKSAEELKIEQKKKDADLSLRENLDRSLEYPIGNERDDEKDWFKPFDFGEKEEVVDEEFLNKKKEYKDLVNSCIETNLGDYGVERNLANHGNVLDNVAFMSINFEETISCLADMGSDIIDEFYDTDLENVQEIEKKVNNLYLKAGGADISPDFCGHRCSLKALMDMQLAKINKFRDYLIKLIDEAS